MRWITNLVAATVFATSLLVLAHVSGQSLSKQHVRQALGEQDRWLADQSVAEGWNKYLQNADLKRQLDAEGSPDQGVLHTVLGKYESGAAGLSLPQFAATRMALTTWLNEVSQPSLADLAAQAKAAKEGFKPISKASVLQREVAAEAAARRLDKYLKNSGRNGESWISYLHLTDLQAELKKGLDADAKFLHEVAARFVNRSPGLELPQFQGVAITLGPYADSLAAYQNTDAKSANAKDLDSLADALDAAAKQPIDIDRAQVGELLGRISASGQNATLVAAVRQRISQPNLLVRVAAPIVAGGIDNDVQETTPVQDVILGTDVEGKGNTKAQVRASLVPNNDRAVVQINLKGSTVTKTVGYHGIVTIFSHGSISLDGKQRIEIDKSAFSSTPACAECCTKNDIDCIDVCAGRLITRIATNRVYGSQCEAEAIAGEHAENRLENRMDTRSGKMLANVNRGYNQKFHDPLVRLGAFPTQFDFSTTRDWLSIVGLQARSNELGAATAAPDASSDAQLSIRVHESAIENFVSAALAGQTLHDEGFKRMMRNLGGKKLTAEEFKVLLRNIGNADEKYDDFSALLKDRLGKRTNNPDEDKPIIDGPNFNVLFQAINDKKVTQDQVNKYFQGVVAEPLTAEKVNAMLDNLPEESQATLTFADTQPVTLRFRDGAVDVTLHAQAYSSSTGVKRDVPMDIRAIYKPAIHGGEMVATRQGELDISPPGAKPGAKLDNEQIAARTALRKRFEDIFKPELKSTGLTLRGNWKDLGELPWVQVTVADGWAAAGWKLPEAQKTAQLDAHDDAQITKR